MPKSLETMTVRFIMDLRELFGKIIQTCMDLFVFRNNKILCKIRLSIYRVFGMKIGNSNFFDSGFRFYSPKNIEIGENCSFGHYTKIWAYNKVFIGDYVQTAIGVTIVSGSHDSTNYSPLTQEQEVFLEGENWIGANVTILGGVRIGKGSIIGAGAVVINDIPPYSIAVGIPAKVIKKREPGALVESPFGMYIPQCYKKQ